VDRAYPGRQRIGAPAAAAVVRPEGLAALGGAIEALRPRAVDGNAEHRAARRGPELEGSPAAAVVAHLAGGAEVAVESGPAAEIEGVGLVGRNDQVAAIGLALAERGHAHVAPVRAAVLAAEHADAGDGVDHARMAATHDDAVQIDGIVDDIEAVADAGPGLAAVEAAQDAADLDAGVDLVRVRRVDRHAGHALGLRDRAQRDVGED